MLDSEALRALRAEAAEWLAKPAVLSPEQHTAQRYAAAGLLEDAGDVVGRDPILASALLGEAVLAMLRYWLLAQNGFAARNKLLLLEIERGDSELGALARRFFAASRSDDRLATAYAIADRTVRARGFFEWESEPIQVLTDGAFESSSSR